MEIRRATGDDIDPLARLFDAYREFYRAPANLEGARRFLLERLEKSQSIILLAFHEDAAVGFTQLYPSFSSVSLARIFILNDLFVAPEARRTGAGSALLQAAAEYAKSEGAVRLELSTERGNSMAQAVYERLGWKRDEDFYVYRLAL